MTPTLEPEIAFTRLTAIPPPEILAHMSNPRIGLHLPLLTRPWDLDTVARFVAAKEACWQRDGLGHWAILRDGRYIGWGGFQREDDEWDYGLVLTPEHFGLGARITRLALDFAIACDRIPAVTFRLPLSRTRLGALTRLGASFVGEIEQDGIRFRRYRLATGSRAARRTRRDEA